MAIASTDDIGRLILRLTVGVTVLFHGVAKLFDGVDQITGMVAGVGLPAYLGYAVFLGEVLGPVLMILGFYARIGALLVAINMLVAIALVHSGEIFTLDRQGAWAIELQALMLFGAIASALLGPGRPAINRR